MRRHTVQAAMRALLLDLRDVLAQVRAAADVWRSSAQIWAELHEQAFRRLGGTVKVIVRDNLGEELEMAGFAPSIDGRFSGGHRGPDRVIWLPLARKAAFWRLAGTLVGTAGVAESDSIR